MTGFGNYNKILKTGVHKRTTIVWSMQKGGKISFLAISLYDHQKRMRQLTFLCKKICYELLNYLTKHRPWSDYKIQKLNRSFLEIWVGIDSSSPYSTKAHLIHVRLVFLFRFFLTEELIGSWNNESHHLFLRCVLYDAKLGIFRRPSGKFSLKVKSM